MNVWLKKSIIGAWPNDDINIKPSSSWVTCFYFVTLSATIITLGHFHQQILDSLFRIGNDVVINAPSAMWDGIRFTCQVITPMIEQNIQENTECLFHILKDTS